MICCQTIERSAVAGAMAKRKGTDRERLERMRDDLGEKYYQNLEDMFEKYDVYVHDIKHTMRAIAALAEEGNCEEIKSLIAKQQDSLGTISRNMICRHKILNALFLERRAYAEKYGLRLDVEVREPFYLDEIDDLDLIVMIGNLLDNAIEGEKRAKQKDGIFCDIRVAREGKHTLIQIENSSDEKDSKKEKASKQARIGEKHGIGLRSVNQIVQKYGGLFDGDIIGGRYLASLILPIESKWEL